MVPESIIQDIMKDLQSLNVCQRCVLRFLSIKSYTSYLNKSSIDKTLQDLLSKTEENVNESEKSETEMSDEKLSPSPKRYNPTPCAACLGILQDSCEDMAPKIEAAVLRSGHAIEDFALQLSLPVVVDLRQELFFLYFNEKFNDKYTFKACDVSTVKDVWKWVVGSGFERITGKDYVPDSSFQIAVSITYPETIDECSQLFEHCPEAFPNRKVRKIELENVFTRAAVLKAMDSLSSVINNLYTVPPAPPSKMCVYEEIQCTHSPLYLGGRYNKYSRELSQTAWVVAGERRMESSVNELITNIVEKRIVSNKIVFSASGREDVDVKMLGDGRPFVLEIINPRKIKWTTEEIRAMEEEINSSTDAIAVNSLQIVTKKDTQLLKEGEEQKRKSYSAVCVVEKSLSEQDINKLNAVKDLKIQQKTPLRVLHRRTLAERERLLHSIEAKLLDEHQLQMKMVTQAGTYVKEFVHGDFGRTEPNLGSLLDTRADILELDVEGIELAWPPKSK